MFQNIKLIVLFVLILFVSRNYVRGDLDNNASLHARSCMGQTLITDELNCNECPDGYICSATRANFGALTTTRTFTMTKTTTNLYGNSTITTTVSTARTTTIVNNNNNYVGQPITQPPNTGFTFSPSSSTTQSGTSSGLRDPSTICIGSGTTGLKPYTDDGTCTKFIVCSLSGSTLSGVLFNCPLGLYFDASSNFCVAQKPVNCY